MHLPPPARRPWTWLLPATLLLTPASAQQPAAPTALDYDLDTKALLLARAYREGGDGARPAVLEALRLMGWGVRDVGGEMVAAPPAGTDTGLALRDYELDELLWRPGEQIEIRLISFAQAIAVPFRDADPEELAQDLVASIRQGTESTQPQRRFWARFIVALGRVNPANYDLTQPAPAPSLPPDQAGLKQLSEQQMQELARNPLLLVQAMKPRPLWDEDDPVLAPSPQPSTGGDTRSTTLERDEQRMDEISAEMGRLAGELSSGNQERINAAQERMKKLQLEMSAISARQQALSAQALSGSEPRFLAEWRAQPLCLLQVALITRVLAADLRQAAAGTAPRRRADAWRGPFGLPLAAIAVAQAAAQAQGFGEQFSGAAGDIWAVGSGGYTSAVLEHHLPGNRFSTGVGVANALIAWFKTIMSIARQKITVDVENAPLVRTKTRSPGEQRTARAKVEIDFPSGDTLKAIRAAMNVSTIDLDLPDGGPVSGARVVWRLPEGSYNTKYQTKGGGWAYRPEFAVVQFARAGSNAAYISTTNSEGVATITLEGVPQRRTLSSKARPYPRRAVVAVEVTMKVGNLTQDLTDAINVATGGPVGGAVTFVADMVLRTSFFFQKGRVFQVIDWKEPAWEGEFEITVAASGSKHEKGIKGGPDTDLEWTMNRHMHGRLHTPEWAEETEQEAAYTTYGRHQLEVDGDARYFRLRDSSRSRTRGSDNRYEAVGPMQIRPPGHNQLEILSRAEPSGSATLSFLTGRMVLDLKPFFGAECIVGRFEQSGRRSSRKAGPEYLSLLEGLMPSDFTVIQPCDENVEAVEGSQAFNRQGTLPYVPPFDVKVTVEYRLWKNGPPPKNKVD